MSIIELAVLVLSIYGLVWLVAALDVALGRFADASDRIVWALIVFFVPLGCLLYLAAGRNKVIAGGLGFLRRD